MRLRLRAETTIGMVRTICLALALILLLTTTAVAQQTYVSKYDAYFGWANFNSPSIGLGANGFHFQGGMRKNTWLSMGFDYSWAKGSLTLTPDLLPNDLQTRLGGMLGQLAAAGKLPPGYKLAVGSDSTTQTFAAGPVISFRHWKAVTPFVHPSLGAIREVATPTPADAIAKGIVAQLAPTGKKTDWQGFYGGAGGIDLNFHKNFGLRLQTDIVYDHLFNDLLKNGRMTVRFSVGPTFNFGPNIIK